MSNLVTGPLKILMIFTPLLAVPLLAIFGMPNLPKVAESSTESESDAPLWGDANASLSDQGNLNGNELFPPLEAKGAELQQKWNQTSDQLQNSVRNQLEEWTPPPEAMQGWEKTPLKQNTSVAMREDVSLQSWTGSESQSVNSKGFLPQSNSSSAPTRPEIPFGTEEFTQSSPSQMPNQYPDANGARTVVPASLGSQASTSFTLDQGVKRLRSYGITNYQLAPGHQGHLYHFSCLLQSGANSPITYRFEADGNSPEEAMENVLAQIQQWHQNRVSQGLSTP